MFVREMKSATQFLNRATPRLAKDIVKRVIYFGNRRYCPVCRQSARRFRPFGIVRRYDVCCPFCKSLERHRLLWRYLEEKTEFFELTGIRMLHVAAEPCFEERFRRQIGEGYLTADLRLPADVKMDVTEIQFPDNSFDIVYCSHVLEHVPDDRRAMREMCRVLKPEGWAIILVPITVDETIEDLTITDPQERLRLYGQDDHVRRYGPDFVGRLQASGFVVKVTSPEEFLSDDEITRLALRTKATGVIIHCTKNGFA
jgi:SAM-dependent methyltransferase